MWKFLNGKWILFAPDVEGAGGEPEGEEPDDEPEPEDEPQDDPEPEGEEPEGEPDPGLSRKETRVQRLANEAKAEREERIRLQARLDEQDRQRNTRQPDNREAERIRAEKLALMEPAEKVAFFASEKADRLENLLNSQAAENRDFRDEARYDATASLDTVKGRAYAKNKEWVENALRAERQAGRGTTREALIRLKLGDDLLNAKPNKKQLAAKKEAAAGRVGASQSKPLSARGDVGGSKGGKEETLEQMNERIIAREKSEGRG